MCEMDCGPQYSPVKCSRTELMCCQFETQVVHVGLQMHLKLIWGCFPPDGAKAETTPTPAAFIYLHSCSRAPAELPGGLLQKRPVLGVGPHLRAALAVPGGSVENYKALKIRLNSVLLLLKLAASSSF